ncbi:MAG: mechanosensitive ion channel [Gimesia sp.]|nr:mechanosensitive ion channel [Gimesia sp.]
MAITLSPLLEAQSQPSSKPQVSPNTRSTIVLSPAITAESIQKRIQQAKNIKGLSEENQKKAIDLYNEALKNLDKTRNFQKTAQEFEIDSQNVMQRLDQIKAEIKSLNKQPAPSFSQYKTLSDLERKLVKDENQYETDKQELSDWEAEIARRGNRQKEALSRISKIDEQAVEIEKQLKVPAPVEEPAAISEARKVEHDTHLTLFQFEKPALKNELTKFDAEETAGFSRIKLDYLKLKSEKQKESLEALKVQIKNRRNIESAMRVKEARKKVFATNPLLQPLVEQNQKYAEEIQQLNNKIETVEQSISKASQVLEDLKKQFAQTKEKEKSIGLTGPIGLLLRNQQAMLPDIEIRQQNINSRSIVIDEVHLKLFELDEYWADFPTAVSQITEIKKNSKRALTTEEEIDLNTIVEEALAKQKEYLDTLIRSNKNYFDKLLTLDATETDLVKQTNAYSDYIKERIFWIKSSAPFSLTELKQIPDSFSWLFSSKHWKELFTTIRLDIYKNPVIYFTAFFCFLSLVYLAYSVRQQLRIINKEITRTNYRQFGITARVAFLTLFIAIIWPGLIWFLAWRIGSNPNAPLFVKTVDESLRQVAWLLFFWELIRQTCRPLGLGESHFGWYQQTVSYVRKNIRWVTAFSLPLLFLTLLMHGKEIDRNQDLLERLFFVALLVVYTIFARRVFHPQSGLFQSILNYNQEVWYDRAKSVIYFLTLFVPCVLILLSLIGYYFTAITLFHLIFMTLWLFLGVIIFRALLLRWILIHHRKLSYQQNLDRFHATRKDSHEPSAESTIAGITTEEEGPADLTKISTQIKKLINASISVILLVGLFGIWGETLPAFNRLDTAEYALWSTSIQTMELKEGTDGKSTRQLVDKLEPVTYFDLGLAIIFAIFSIIATKNIPGLLEFLVLQRLPLEASVKYAITSLARYFIALVGIFIVFTTIGLGWTKLQWLATALTFGLAFGLQEIFANFVSGLILLIERPIRVGDIITVDEVTGVVSRIRMRATTITNWDRKEYIVPNREFITGKLLNWTLTDSVNRLMITVGVAYGTDTNQVSDLSHKILTSHPLVLSDPPPSITFESFGDSTLNLTLRAYLPNLENRLTVIHELNTAIHEQFAEAGFEIAFPQRDIHLYTANKSLTESVLNVKQTEPHQQNNPEGTD